MDAAGAPMAERAPDGLADCSGSDGEVITTVKLIDAEPGEVRKEGSDAHGVGLLDGK
jgi:hypothetical protein